jgi:hypothetical protein
MKFVKTAPAVYTTKHYRLVFGFHRKQVCLSKPVKVINLYDKNTTLQYKLSIFRTLQIRNVLSYRS